MEKQVTIREFIDDLMNNKESFLDICSRNGKIPKIYLHWSASRYFQVFSDYHLNILGDGRIIQTKGILETPSATWKRNVGSIAITLACCYDANSNGLGDFPPTGIQIETISQLMAKISGVLEIPIIKKHFLTHGEAADNEDGEEITEKYGPKTTCERWDLEFLGTNESMLFNPYDEEHRGGQVLRGKAIWYKYHV